MHHIEWIKILSLALQLLHAAEMDSTTELVCRWASAESINYIAPDSANALVVEFRLKENSVTLAEYIIIPRQNLYKKKITEQSNGAAVSPDFMTVNKDAIIYKKNFPITGQNNIQKACTFDDLFKKSIGYDSCQALIRKTDSFTLAGGLQVISLEEYPYFIELKVAQPGSKAVQKSIPDGLPAHKMIHQYLIPDFGPIHEQWIFQPFAYSDSSVTATEDSVLRIFLETFTEAVNGLPDYYRKAYYQKCRERIDAYLRSASWYSAGLSNFWEKELKRLMFAGSEIDQTDAIHSMYPDYEPKTTPDDAYDYRPSLSGYTACLPAAERNNLPALLDSFAFYKKAAKKNPGRWRDGKVMLGANAQEYYPSNEELILNEIGERIRLIIDSTPKEDLDRIRKEKRLRKKSISYRQFTFRHCDVMGSGRFFYVDQILDVKVDLRKP